MNYVLRDYQEQASDAAVKFFNSTRSDRNGVLVLPTGCHAKGTLVLMKSGDFKKVEDIEVGDLLMGNDGRDRTVLRLHHGIDDMFRVMPIKGEPFVVNGGHVLHLYKTNEGKNSPSCKPRYDEITVKEFVAKSANYKHLHKLHRARLVEFEEEAHLPLPPYFVGLYLGDGGSTSGVSITTQREEVASYLYGFAEELGVSVRVALKNNGLNKAKSYYFPLKKSHANPLTLKIRELNLEHKTAGEKYIPQIYKVASPENRFMLLAGLLDTDAYYDVEGNIFEYCSKSKQLAEDVVFLCRSLGLYAMMGKTKYVKNVAYHRIQISGDLDMIPTRVAIRKGHKRQQKKSHLVTGFSVEYIGRGEYYGFTLDGNHLYLDSQFFVHHNSGKSLIVADIASKLRQNVLVLQPSREILAQNYAKYKSYGMENCSIYSASFNSKEISEVTFATIGSIMAHIDDFDHFKAIIIDEAQAVNPVEGQYATFIRKVKRKVLGLTATPYRLATAQGIETADKGFMPNGSFKSSDYFLDDFMPMPGVVLKNACILKFITRTRPRIFHDVLYEVSIQTLLQRGYLARLRYFDMTVIDTSRVRRNSTGRDYDEQSLSKEFSRCELSSQLSNLVKRLLRPKNGIPRKGILVFTQFITESERLARDVEGVAVVTGATKKKDRERILDDFKSGKIKVLANVGVLTCLSSDTEILTKNKGWVGINDIDSSDMVAQYDANTEVIDFAHPQRIIKKEFDEDFVSIEGRYMNFKVTHDHNMLFRRRVENHLGVPRRCKALELVFESRPYIPVSGYTSVDIIVVPQDKRCSDKRFLATNSYNYRKRGMSKEEAQDIAHKMLKLRNSRRYKNPNELTFDECRFIGFWLGDGSMYKSKEGRRYSVSQSCCNPLMIEWVENILEKCGIHYNKQYYTVSDDVAILGRKCHVSDHITYNLALGTGGNKQNVESNLYSLLPYLQKSGSNLYWGLNREQFFCLMEGYFKANGGHGNNRIYTGQASVGANKELFDLLQAIGVCRGYRVAIQKQKDREHTKKTLYRISMGDYRYHQMVRDKAKIVPNKSKEQVWCVTMPKGTIVTRRNGRVTIMGNCGFDYPELDTVVIARPTMSLAMYYQMVGRCIRPYEGKDGWVVDLGGNIKRFGKVDDLTLREDKPEQYYISGVVEGQEKQLTNIYF